MKKIHMFMLIVSLKSISSLSNLKPTNKNIDLTPARYKVANKPSHDSSTKTGQFVINSEFPQVEYPTSIVDSSKPYYSSSLSPFPDDVKAAFDALVLREIQKPKPSDYSVSNNKKQDELHKPKNTQPEELTTTVTEENSKNHSITANKTVSDVSDAINDKDTQLINVTTIENFDESSELESVLSFIEDLETVVATLDSEAKMQNFTINKFDKNNLNLTDSILDETFEINENKNEPNAFDENVYNVDNRNDSSASFGD